MIEQAPGVTRLLDRLQAKAPGAPPALGGGSPSDPVLDHAGRARAARAAGRRDAGRGAPRSWRRWAPSDLASFVRSPRRPALGHRCSALEHFETSPSPRAGRRPAPAIKENEDDPQAVPHRRRRPARRVPRPRRRHVGDRQVAFGGELPDPPHDEQGARPLQRLRRARSPSIPPSRRARASSSRSRRPASTPPTRAATRTCAARTSSTSRSSPRSRSRARRSRPRARTSTT